MEAEEAPPSKFFIGQHNKSHSMYSVAAMCCGKVAAMSLPTYIVASNTVNMPVADSQGRVSTSQEVSITQCPGGICSSCPIPSPPKLLATQSSFHRVCSLFSPPLLVIIITPSPLHKMGTKICNKEGLNHIGLFGKFQPQLGDNFACLSFLDLQL